MNEETIRQLVPWFVALLVGVMVISLLAAVRQEGRRRRTWIEVPARILEVKQHLSSSGNENRPSIDYAVRCTYRTPDGQERVGWATDPVQRFRGRPGEVIPIWCDPRQPAAFTVKAPMSPLRSMLVFGSVFGFLALFGAFFFVIWRSQQ
jgi:hypothetical protein